MIQLKQNNYDIGNLASVLQKFGIVSLKLNKNIIDDDIYKMNIKIPSSKSSNKQSIERVVAYLEKLKSKIDDDGNYQMSWMLDNWKIKSYPLSLRSFPEYNILASDYIVLGKGRLVKLDYTELFQIMAFEMMYRDLGYSLENIEEDLGDVGLTIVNDTSRLQPYIEEDALSCSKFFKIDNCPYASINGKVANDYFYTSMEDKNLFQSGQYKEIVDRSINVAIDLIIKDLIDTLTDMSIEFQLYAINEDGIYFWVNQEDFDIDCINNIIIRVFGRKFEVEPKIEIF